MPQVEYKEDAANQASRFEATILINGKVVAIGTGSNKNQAKLDAHKYALLNIAKLVYQQWLEKTKENVIMKESSKISVAEYL